MINSECLQTRHSYRAVKAPRLGGRPSMPAAALFVLDSGRNAP
jgi:hypothetical protein